MNASNIGGYRLVVGNWERITALVRGKKNSWDDDRIILVFPDLTVKDEPYVVSAEMSITVARDLVKTLQRAIKLVDPPKPRQKRG